MVKYRNLRKGEEDKLTEVMYQVFPRGVANSDYFRTRVMTEDSYSPDNVKVAVDERGNILSHVVVQPRRMYSDKGILNVGGIALVGTHPEHRGKGLSSRLLEMAVKDIKNADNDATMLFTKNPFFESKSHGKEGWGKVLKREYVIVNINPGMNKPFSHDLFDVGQNVCLVDTFPSIYRCFCNKKSFFVEREKSQWRNLELSLFDGDRILFHFEPVSGYASYQVKGGKVEIQEAVWDNQEMFQDIVSLATRIAEKRNLKKIGMPGPWLKSFDAPMEIIDTKDGINIEEDLRMLPLKDDVKVPEEPILFWPNDHF